MKRMKKSYLFIALLALIFIGVPSLSVSAAEGYAVDVDTKETVEKITTHTITTGDDTDIDKIKEYYVMVPVDTKETILPITFAHKGIFVCYADLPVEDNASGTGYFEIYTDKECTNQIQYSSYSYKAIIPEAGTYYLKFYVTDYENTIEYDSYLFNFASQFYNSDNQTLTNNKTVCSGLLDESTPVYYKVTTSKAGSLSINTGATYSSYITLLNSKKKAISDECYVSSGDSTTCFAVPKGTYYVKVSSYSTYFYIKSTFKGITDASGTTKAKAKKLEVGKVKTGIVTTSDKKGKVDWYKITLTKSQSVSVMFTGSVSSGKIELEFYGNGISGSLTESISTVNSDKSFTAQTWTSTKLPKGTYYIKVTKKSTNTSGFYSLKFKK